jgi:riboflavin synthase
VRSFGEAGKIGYLESDARETRAKSMFTGIIEHIGTIESLETDSAHGCVKVHARSLAGALKVSASIAVNGCCLTIVEATKGYFSADLSAETLNQTSFRALRPGTRVNLEQPLTAGKEFGGHFVLGHVDGTGRVSLLAPESKDSGNWRLTVEIPAEVARYVVAKGSITIDGISLTVARATGTAIDVAVIPYTYEHTNLHDRKPGESVNLEADILGKYIERYIGAREDKTPSNLNVRELIEQGF